MLTLILLMLGMTPQETMLNRNVLVTADGSVCSGIILSTGLVLTVFHAIEIDSEIRVDGATATIKLPRPDIDLLLLEVPTAEFPMITFVSDPQIGNHVFQTGNPIGLEDTLSQGYIINVTSNFIYTDTLAIPGGSGGGVFNDDGELMGMVQKMFGAEKGGWMVRSLKAEIIAKAVAE